MVVMRGASLRVQAQVVLAHPWPIRWSPNVTFLENTTPTPARAKSRSISTFTHGARSGARERRAQHLKPLIRMPTSRMAMFFTLERVSRMRLILGL